MEVKYLSGHVSPETAYVVDDYPYGFRLRCKIRYWLEYKDGKGFRFVSQTTNPKVAGEVWNKPKAGVYISGPAVMFLDENNHVHYSVAHFSGELKALEDFRAMKAEFLPAEFLPILDRHIALKREYEKLKARGLNFNDAFFAAQRRILSADKMKQQIKDGIISKFGADAVTDKTIGEVEDFLAEHGMTTKDFYSVQDVISEAAKGKA